MTLATDIIDRANQMNSDRIFWVNVWMDIARLVLPTENPETSFNLMMSGVQKATIGSTAGTLGGLTFPNAPSRVKSIYDNTGMMSCERLASGMESLVTPQSEKWHGLAVSDILHDRTTDEENQYLERLRDFVFNMRYDPSKPQFEELEINGEA